MTTFVVITESKTVRRYHLTDDTIATVAEAKRVVFDLDADDLDTDERFTLIDVDEPYEPEVTSIR